MKTSLHHAHLFASDIEESINFYKISHMKSNGFQFKKKVKNLGVWKYIMAEGPDHVLLELFQVVKEKLTEDQYKKISCL